MACSFLSRLIRTGWYFTTLAEGRMRFLEQIEASGSEFIASVRSQAVAIKEREVEPEGSGDGG
jgi:hypothetical protein